MAYTVTKLINDAYYASGIVSRDFEQASGSQLSDGLDFLNDILADKTIEKDMLPYYLRYNFYAEADVEKYFIPNLEQIETIVFFINSVRYQMAPTERNQYFGSSRAMNIQSLPFSWHMERCVGGANIYMYFSPDTNYPIEVWGQFRLAQVTLNQDLEADGTNATLGVATFAGAGTLSAGQLVINNVSVIGSFANIASLINYINETFPDIVAYTVGTQFLLSDRSNGIIRLTTSGDADPAACVTFSEFSTTQGPNIETFVPTKLDRFFINYLKFALASRLSVEFNFIVPPGVINELNKYQNWISKRSAPLDLSMVKISTLGGQNGINYAVVNLSNGWTP